MERGKSIEALAALAELVPPGYRIKVSLRDIGLIVSYGNGRDYGDESLNDHPTLADEILACVNAARSQAGLDPVQWPEGEAE